VSAPPADRRRRRRAQAQAQGPRGGARGGPGALRFDPQQPAPAREAGLPGGWLRGYWLARFLDLTATAARETRGRLSPAHDAACHLCAAPDCPLTGASVGS
jgi:hypothetical protein